MLNKCYERISEWLASTWFIGLFTLWLIYSTVSHREYIHFISELAILIGLLILRAESAQSKRMEKAVKDDLKKSEDIIRMLRENVPTK